MANIDAVDYRNPSTIPHGGTYGNLSFLQRSITLAADAAIADVLRFVRLQANVRLIDAVLFTDANAAASTVSLGFATVGGEGDAPAHFLSGESIATAGQFRANAGNPPAVVPDEFDLVLTVAGAVIPAGTTVTVALVYEFIGHK